MAQMKEVELFTEILASSKLGTYQNFSQYMSSAFGADQPSVLWDQLKYNPWLAMAVYADMEEKDAAIFSALDARKNSVLSKTRNILPSGDRRVDRRVAEFVETALELHFNDFETFLYESLDAIGKGVSIGEIIFQDSRDGIVISDVRFKPQHLFSFGESDIAGFSTASMAYPQTGDLQLRSGIIHDLPVGSTLPEDKFFVFSFRPKYGNRWGDPVDRKAFWPSWIKRSSIKEWLKYQEKGTGVVIARYNDGSAEKEMQDAQSAAAAVQEESAVAIPKKFILEVHEMVRQIGSSHKELVDDFCNAEIMRIYLGQTLTSRGSDGGGSRALGEVHERKEHTIGEADAKALMTAVNEQIIRPLVRLNFGANVEPPKWVIETEPKEDAQAKAKLFATARKELGMDLSKQQIRDDLMLEEPDGDDDTLTPPPEADKPSNNDPLDDALIESAFAEGRKPTGQEGAGLKKKHLPGSATRSSLRMDRFMKLRPSMIEFSND